MAIIRKLESLGGNEVTKPRDGDNVTIGYQIFDYAPQEHGRDCRGKPLRRACVESKLSQLQPPCLQAALLCAGGGMSVNEKATFIVSAEADEGVSNIGHSFVLELHLRAVNHALKHQNIDAYTYLPQFEEAVEVMQSSEWLKMERAFTDVKAVFAEYNKWDDYGIMLPFKDVDLRDDERLIDFNGTSIPWHGSMVDVLERCIIPRCLRSSEGQIVPYSFYFREVLRHAIWDVSFEQEAILRLGGLALVRLEDYRSARDTSITLQVEGIQGGVVVSYPPRISNMLLKEETLIPVMWKFCRCKEGASDRYRLIATRFRRMAEYTPSSDGRITPQSGTGSMQPEALFADVASRLQPQTPLSSILNSE